jgi:hypothetical protein
MPTHHSVAPRVFATCGAFLVALAGVLCSARAATDGPFLGQAFPTFYTDGAALADVNGDGHPDVIAARSILDQVAVLPGGAGGIFGHPQGHATDVDPHAVTAADFNGDGLVDVAALSYLKDRVSVLIGDGGGGFAAPVGTAVGEHPLSAAAGDLDGDGRSDLAISFPLSKTCRVALAAPDGSLLPPVLVPLAANLVGVALADMDTDGVLDLVSLHFGTLAPAAVGVSLGVGDGSFLPEMLTPTLPSGSSLAVGRINGDGVPDVVVAGSFGTPNLQVLLGVGDGSLAPLAGADLVPGQPSLIRLADVNGDGATDLALTHGFTAVVSVRLGDGQGLFGEPAIVPAAGAFTQGLEFADLTGDGALDLLSIDTLAVVVRPGLGDGSFLAPGGADFGDAFPVAAALADLSADGLPDLVFTDAFDLVQVGLGSGDGTFTPLPPSPAGEDPGALAVGDLDADGWPDVVTANLGNDTVTVLRSTGGGALAAPVSYAVGGYPRDLELGDIDGDGLLDVITANDFTSDLSWLKGLGGGALAAAVSLPIPDHATSLAVGDANGDGHLDIAVVTLNLSEVFVLLGKGGGTFQHLIHQFTGSLYHLGAVDFVHADLDALPDLLLVGTGGAALMLGNGNGTFRAPMVVLPQAGRTRIADVDRDGIPDVVALAGAHGDLVFARGLDGLGATATPVAFATGGPAVDVVVGELDLVAGELEGGALDAVVVRSSLFTDAVVFLNQCPPVWEEVGGGVAGALGVPQIEGQGTLLAGAPVQVKVSGALAGAPALVVLGFAPSGLPFKGGTLVPAPEVVVAGLLTGAAGTLLLQETWPPGVPAGTAFWTQAWIADASAVAGWSATDGLKASVP